MAGFLITFRECLSPRRPPWFPRLVALHSLLGCKDSRAFTEQILCGIDVAVVNSSAYGAGPLPYLHVLHIPVDGAACPAKLAGREIPVHDHQFPTVPSALVFEQTAKLAPPGIGNGFCASTLRRVRNHASDVKVLDDYHVVGFDEICRELVECVISCIADTFMDPRHLVCLAPSAVGLRFCFLASFRCSMASRSSSLPKCRGLEMTDTCLSLSNIVA